MNNDKKYKDDSFKEFQTLFALSESDIKILDDALVESVKNNTVPDIEKIGDLVNANVGMTEMIFWNYAELMKNKKGYSGVSVFINQHEPEGIRGIIAKEEDSERDNLPQELKERFSLTDRDITALDSAVRIMVDTVIIPDMKDISELIDRSSRTAEIVFWEYAASMRSKIDGLSRYIEQHKTESQTERKIEVLNFKKPESLMENIDLLHKKFELLQKENLELKRDIFQLGTTIYDLYSSLKKVTTQLESVSDKMAPPMF